MTDLFNTKENEDRQQMAVAARESGVGSPASLLYSKGEAILNRFQFEIKPDLNGTHAYHSVWYPVKPKAIKGISYPDFFRPMTPIFSFDQQEKLERIFSLQDEDVSNFWRPFYSPNTTRDTPFHAYTERLFRIEQTNRALNEYEPFEFGISFDPIGTLSGIVPPKFHPKQWIPDESWFAPNIRQLAFEDVFTIWPKAEANLLKLILGRICVGRTNHIPYGWQKPIEHTTRIAAIIVGEDPGLGKSTIFNHLWRALSKCGYTISTFRQITERFGIEDPAKADVAYKDDVVSSSLKSFVAAEETKIITTGGKLRVEGKFQAPIDVWPRGVLLLNANEFDPQIAYNLDPGIIDRVKLLSTIRAIELDSRRTELGPLASQSPDIRPASHLPWLAEKLGCDIDAIMLWACRLAVNYFYGLMTNSTREVNLIERQVHKDTSYLRLTLDKSVTRSFICSLVLAFLLRRYDPNFTLPEMNLQLISIMLQDFYYVAVDPLFVKLRTAIKEDWNAKDRPEIHPWVGIRKVQLATVKRAQVALSESLARKASVDAAIKATFEQILLRNGFKLSSSVVWLASAWKSVKPATLDILRLADSLLNSDLPNLDKLEIDRPMVNDSHLFDPLYDPQTVDHIQLSKQS